MEKNSKLPAGLVPQLTLFWFFFFFFKKTFSSSYKNVLENNVVGLNECENILFFPHQISCWSTDYDFVGLLFSFTGT